VNLPAVESWLKYVGEEPNPADSFSETPDLTLSILGRRMGNPAELKENWWTNYL
jgi:hypothetical protein